MTERIEKLRKFLETSPDDCFLNHAVALEYVKMGLEKDALAHFERNRTNDPSYVATYYHMGKLQERTGNTTAAVATYEAGMAVARAAGDMHSYNELRAVWEDLTY